MEIVDERLERTGYGEDEVHDEDTPIFLFLKGCCDKGELLTTIFSAEFELVVIWSQSVIGDIPDDHPIDGE